ncbi:raffinose/stachyose/melibiose transport system permease protein [Paenibacillus sp. UNCCL117]|uniref:carbohydrate ABC transporter permease n=1 Tax=unclassified Paenibacillus TaxID=185978 RepID=UPI0008808AFC|nr:MULTISPECIES: sugar ABC transporter permease [unclassified Paenibacillus]SDD61738.1 raffinose/stachyose/melibiose transport system permease protein [Paenibacillus sp. cl123]SFW67554.1 raffinose/stachyose/melibiose transport system permease protein [Paenibacillus sp. UNCCL117]
MAAANRVRGFIFIGLLPALLIYTVFVIIPIFWSAFYGFFDWKGIGAMKYVGFANYMEVLQDPVFWRAFKNNLIIVAASIFGQVPIALFLSLVLWKSSFFHRFVRSAVFMPMVLASVVIGIIWGYIYNPQIGILNYLLDSLGLSSWIQDWLGDPKVNMYSVSVPIVWANIGPYLILFIAAIQNISSEVEDAAKIDGAVGFRRLYLIVVPMIWDTIKVAIVLCISGSLKAFDLIYVMTHGGPAQSTELLATYMYNSTFNVFRYGYGASVSTLIIIFSMILVLGSQILMKRKQD